MGNGVNLSAFNLNGVDEVMGRIQTTEGIATIRTDKNRVRVSVIIDDLNKVLLFTDKYDNLYCNRYGKNNNHNHIVTNVTNMNGNETNECRMIIRTVSKKTGKPCNFTKSYTYEQVTKYEDPYMRY